MLAKANIVVQLAIGLVFLLSTLGKLTDLKGFGRGIAKYGILPRFLTYPIALLLTILEGLLALSHLTGGQIGLGRPLGFVTLATFGGVVALNLFRGRRIPCYCFGKQAEILSARTLMRLILMILGESFIIVLSSKESLTYQPLTEMAASQVALELFWAVFVTLTASWLLNLTELRWLFKPITAVIVDRRTDLLLR
jgi:Methylamine utilisation protein MauE